jgi:Mg2+ and Co2+ transporter CorA
MSPKATDYVTHGQLDASLAKFGEMISRRIVDEITEAFSDYVSLIDKLLTKLEKRYEVQERKMDEMLSRMDDAEQVNKVQDSRLGRLETKVFGPHA